MQWSIPAADKYFRPLLAADPRGFEIDHLEIALKHCRDFRIAIDGGAHIGTWSASLARRFESVLAFEPAADTAKCLIDNTIDFYNVHVFRMALGPCRARAAIKDDQSRPGNTGSRHLGKGDDIDVVPLDEMNLSAVDFIKLDVEGYELFALQGAAKTIDRCKPTVLIEAKRFNPPRFDVTHEDASKFLCSLGYREAARVRNDRVYVSG